MEWQTLLAYITGTVDKALLLRNEYLKDTLFSNTSDPIVIFLS